MKTIIGLTIAIVLSSALYSQIPEFEPDPGLRAIDPETEQVIYSFDHNINNNPYYASNWENLEIVVNDDYVYGRGYTYNQAISYHLWGTINTQGDFSLNISMDWHDPEPYTGFYDSILDHADDFVENFANTRSDLYDDLTSNQREWNNLSETEQEIVDHFDDTSFDDVLYYADEYELEDMLDSNILCDEKWDKAFEAYLILIGWYSP